MIKKTKLTVNHMPTISVRVRENSHSFGGRLAIGPVTFKSIIREFYESLGLIPDDCHEEQEFKLTTNTRVEVFDMNMSVPKELGNLTKWTCNVKGVDPSSTREQERGLDAVGWRSYVQCFLIGDFILAAKSTCAADAVKHLPKDLNALYLAEILIEGDLFKYFGKLTHLCLSGAGSSSMPDLSGLSEAKVLNALKLKGLGLRDIDGLSKCFNSHLTSLDLSGTKDLERLPDLSGLPNLITLDCHSCSSLTDVDALSGLANLITLDLSQCFSLTDVSALSGLSNLTSLDLSLCESLTDVSALSGLSSLISLDLRRWEGRGSLTDVSALSGLSNLTSLDLSGSGSLTDVSVLSGLSNLTSLDLSGCGSLTDVSALSGLANLITLELSGCDGMRSLLPLAGLCSLQVFRFTSRRISSIEPLREIAAIREFEGFNPPEVAELLTHAAVLRGDGPFILKNSTAWLMEATVWQDAPRGMLNRFAATLGDAFTLLGESPIDSPYEDFISRRPEFTSAPWKAWFGGTLKESGFDLYRRRVERVPLVEMTSGAIGGACLTLPLQEHMDWSHQWLADLEKSCLGDAKTLLPVAPEICLAYARSGDRQALRRWLEAFTDPSDPAALDSVHAALAKFQIGRADLAAAGNHVHAIHSPAARDPILGELVVHLAESDGDLASASLLLIEDQALRIDMAKKLAAKSSASEVLIHRCIVAAGESPQAVADLISALPQTSRSELVVQLSKKLQTDRKTMLLGIADELRRQADRLSAQALEVD